MIENPYSSPRASRIANVAAAQPELGRITKLVIGSDALLSAVQAVLGVLTAYNSPPVDTLGWVATIALVAASIWALVSDAFIFGRRRRGLTMGLVAGAASILAAVLVFAVLLFRFAESGNLETANRAIVQFWTRLAWNVVYLVAVMYEQRQARRAGRLFGQQAQNG